MNFLRILIILFGILTLNSATVPTVDSSYYEDDIIGNQDKIKQNAKHFKIRNAEQLACGTNFCNVIKEFLINEKDSFDCYSETLPIRFQIILPNGTERTEKSYIPLMKKFDNQEGVPIFAYNIVLNAPIAHRTCLRIKR